MGWGESGLLRYFRNDKSLTGTASKPLLPLGAIRKAALAARDSGSNLSTEADAVNSHGVKFNAEAKKAFVERTEKESFSPS